jgi:hypothetical protein
MFCSLIPDKSIIRLYNEHRALSMKRSGKVLHMDTTNGKIVYSSFPVIASFHDNRSNLEPSENQSYVDYYQEQSAAYQKQIKGGSRQDKIDLINKLNPPWCDLYERL